MKNFVILLCLVSCAVALVPRRRVGLRAPHVPPGTKLPQPQWVQQYLDHFDKSSKTTWKQRYFVNDTWWDKENGPIFILLGGEGPDSPEWLVADTEIMINAQKFSAMVVTIEHRFYGESHPTSNLSLSNMKYLSSRQALADVNYFIGVMNTKLKLTTKNRWISFGGSYSGALSGWVRQLYPDKVTGSVATSAPVLATEDFSAYLEVVSASLQSSSHGTECVTAIREATGQVDAWLSNKNTWKKAEDTFNISPPLGSEMDVALAAQSLAGNFMDVVQYNRDNTAFEGRPNNITIEYLCSVMVNTALGPPVIRYATVSRLMNNNRTLDCNYQSLINEMKSTNWSHPIVKGGARQWYYQTCTEFGYFQTTDSTHQPFGKLISLFSYSDVCDKVFDIKEADIKTAIASTNAHYGGTNVTGTNIVFPNGSIDPWHRLSVLENIGPTVRSFYIHGTAHCANMYPPSTHDPLELTQARDNITVAIGTWLK